MTRYTFQTVEPVHIGSSYGFHTFDIIAQNKPEAWDKVRFDMRGLNGTTEPLVLEIIEQKTMEIRK